MKKIKIIATPTFQKELKKLAKKYPSMKEDYRGLLIFLNENPTPKEYSIGAGLYKIRLKISSLGRGKSGGARVITVVETEISEDGVKIYLARIYEKSEKEDLTLLVRFYKASGADRTIYIGICNHMRQLKEKGFHKKRYFGFP